MSEYKYKCNVILLGERGGEVHAGVGVEEGDFLRDDRAQQTHAQTRHLRTHTHTTIIAQVAFKKQNIAK
jgi:hypothetical protein